MKSKYKNLFIIGNGFDLWQGLPSSYDDFKEYYRNNIQSIVKKMHVKTSKDKDGNLITPVEMVFGDIMRPSPLPDEFFWNFEAETASLDDQALIGHFKKTNRGLYQLQKTVEGAQRILQKAFSDFFNSIEIDKRKSEYRFDDSCFFINFNYTDTLEKRFNCDEFNDYHIHGEASDPESIIFGHSTHPETGFKELMEQRFFHSLSGGKSKRLQGLYLVEEALYETDKHIQDNIDDLCEYMALAGIHIEDFTDIYVLGHSFAETDYEYIDFFVKATQADCDFNELSAMWKAINMGLSDLGEDSLMNLIILNVTYAIQHRKRAIGKDDISFPEAELIEKSIIGKANVYVDESGNIHDKYDNMAESKEAVNKRAIFEQAIRTREILEELCMMKDADMLPPDCCSILKAADYIDGGHDKRISDAKWHISYFSENDKKQIENVMQRAGCRNYELHQGIDECIAAFK